MVGAKKAEALGGRVLVADEQFHRICPATLEPHGDKSAPDGLIDLVEQWLEARFIVRGRLHRRIVESRASDGSG